MSVDDKLDLILSEIQSMKNDVQTLKNDVETLKNDVETLKSDVQTLKSDVQTLKSDVETLKGDVETLKDDMQTLKDGTQTLDQKIVDIHLILENEIRVNIQRVAEGHLDLSRNLHDAMRPSKEVETLSIRVGTLESAMKEVRAKIS